jgi:3',5'-cyclic AMP phosphodiesterase CpdA
LTTPVENISVDESCIRVVCISDTHSGQEAPTNSKNIPDGDILIHAGDLTQSGSESELELALSWLNAQPHPQKLFIAGNHDAALADAQVLQRLLAAFPDLQYLEESSTTVTVRGYTLNVYGSPYTPKHGSWSFQYPRINSSVAETSSLWSEIPLNTDILVTHGPPSASP